MRWFAARTVLISCLVVALPIAAPGQPVAPAGPAAGAAASAPASPPEHVYLLGVGDTIEVALIGRTDFNTRARVGSDGAVLLPYLGAVPASGRTPAILAEEIGQALEKGGFFSKPVIRVDVVGVGSRSVTVLGSVVTPGLLALDREYHLSEVVARVGGRTAGGVDYVVLTHPDGRSRSYKLNELATASGEKDPIVSNGDKIFIPAAENQAFYVTGQVRNPGPYPVVEGMTVRIALARAGGLTDQGSERKVSIKRKGVDLKGVKLDVTTLEPGDIVTVGERLF